MTFQDAAVGNMVSLNILSKHINQQKEVLLNDLAKAKLVSEQKRTILQECMKKTTAIDLTGQRFGKLVVNRKLFADNETLLGQLDLANQEINMYKKYKTPISPMGCRAFLSAWYEKGGMFPADENDKPVFEDETTTGAAKLTWAAEHELGVAKGLDPFVVDGCRDHFKGECSEVGMYLAMARVALREGYPEVAMLFEQIAKEEAEHAARFAELLGEVVSSSTKENIEKMLTGENGACKSKFEIAKYIERRLLL